MNSIAQQAREAFNRDFSGAALKAMVILWGVFMIALGLLIDNKWLLAGILAWEILP